MPTPESHPRQWAVFSQVRTGDALWLCVVPSSTVRLALWGRKNSCRLTKWRAAQLDADGSGTLDVEEIFEYVRSAPSRALTRASLYVCGAECGGIAVPY